MRMKNRTATVTEAAAQAALRRGPAPALAADEEQVARMRLGAPPPLSAPLERKAAAGTDLEIELLAFEIEMFRKWRAHLEQVRAAPPSPAPAAPGSRPMSATKAKIVRALRKKS